MDQQLTPPEGLQAPKPVQAVPMGQATQMVKLDPATVPALDERVRSFVNSVVTAKVHGAEFEKRLAAVHNLGADEIRTSAGVSNRILQRPVAGMQGGSAEGAAVGSSLVDLRRTIEDLDPSQQGDLFSARRFLGVIPMGNRLRDYFMRYESAQGHISAIIKSLYRSQDELRKDNAALEQEKVNLWEIMQKLQQYIYVGKELDAQLSARIAELEAEDPEKARVVREEMLFAVRQRVQDLLTQLAVSIQGYLALDMLRKNNQELIKGVDRATTTTVSALRTAIIVAQALANQKLVLDQINALNATTGNLIESTSAMLRGQSAEIGQQAAGSTVSLEKLQTAFNNVYVAMDQMSTYRETALVAMKQTIDALTSEVEKSRTYVDRVRDDQARAATAKVNLSTDAAADLKL